MNLYNDTDEYCCDWLENLIQSQLIPPGVVDRRDIRDIRPYELVPYIQCHFFAGLGGWPLSLALAGAGPDEPLWTGSCPCQPFSQAGKQRGFSDERHLWPFFQYLIAQRRPAKVLGEQVASASDWLGLVRGDLEALGYAVGAIPIEAASAGADHLRDRFWFVADDEHARERRGRIQRPGESASLARERASDQFARSGFNRVAQGDADEPGLAVGSRATDERGIVWQEGKTASETGHRSHLANSSRNGFAGQRISTQQWQSDSDVGRSVGSGEFSWVFGADGKVRRVKSGIRLLAHGVPARVAKLRALGNAIDPRPAAAFIKAALNLS